MKVREMFCFWDAMYILDWNVPVWVWQISAELAASYLESYLEDCLTKML